MIEKPNGSQVLMTFFLSLSLSLTSHRRKTNFETKFVKFSSKMEMMNLFFLQFSVIYFKNKKNKKTSSLF